MISSAIGFALALRAAIWPAPAAPATPTSAGPPAERADPPTARAPSAPGHATPALPRATEPPVPLTSLAAARALLSSPDPARRLNAIVRIGSLADVETSRPLEPLLDDRDASCRLTAARLLARAGNARALDRLATDAASAEPGTRADALVALREAPQVPPAAGHAVLRALVDEDISIRLITLDLLSSSWNRDATPIVAGALDDPSRDVRLAAVALLGRSGDTRAVVPLLARLDSPDRALRIAVIVALGRLPSPGGVSSGPALVRQLQDPADEVRAAAIESLGRTRTGDAVPALREIALSRARGADRLARRAAAALGEIGGRAATDVLVRLLREPAPASEVVDALKRIGPAAAKPVAALLVDAFPSSAIAAAGVLGAIGDRVATSALVAALGARPAVSGAAARAIGAIGDPTAVGPLIEVSVATRTTSAPSIREACLDALARLRDARAAVAVAPGGGDPDPRVRAAALRLAVAIGGEGATRAMLAARLVDADVSVRLAAIAAARSAGRLHAVDLLLDSTKLASGAGGHTARTITRAASHSTASANDGHGFQNGSDVLPDAVAEALSDALEVLVRESDRPRLLAELVSPEAPPHEMAVMRALAALPSGAPLLPATEARLVAWLGVGGSAARAAAEVLGRAALDRPTEQQILAAWPNLEPPVRARLCAALARAAAPAADALLAASLDADPDDGVRAAAARAARARSEVGIVAAALSRARAADVAAIAENAGARGSAQTAPASPPPTATIARTSTASVTRGARWARIRLLSADGRPAARRWVRVAGGDGVDAREDDGVWAFTDDRGEAWFDDAPPGTIRASAPADPLVAVTPRGTTPVSEPRSPSWP